MTTATATAAPRERAARASSSAPGLGAALRAEWTKLWSLRSTYVVLALSVLIGAGMSALISLAVGVGGEEEIPAGVDPAAQALAMAQIGPDLAVIVFVVLAGGFSAGEYATGLIRLTLGVGPRRWRPLAAKAAVLSGVVLAAGLVVVLAAFLASQAVLDAYGMATVGLGDDGVLRKVLLQAATLPVFPLTALALGFLLRGTAAAITTAIAVMWLPAIIGALLPDWVRENVVRYTPGTAVGNVVGTTAAASPTHMDPWPAAAVVAAWLALSLGAALWSLSRRDA
ncbi:hypothetical protein [Actinorugispora endophytica]|uniref:ABC-type transport system involved in multi-copper enzyme maturation permease subunit n=1 Tax=Actinorugispora endophytica TaxID=1605990 RepID=A0A4R6V3Y0_9ACTN|nr:hypothetical protein [Actinorugispora endophytica]TDQ53428.1 ABC-type transport system involved in multi-copper enzyme maturation permease subunit [Actinorugispora endophytica]